MRPLTATRPKPLVEVAGRSLLDHALDRLRSGGIGTAIVNVHYFADALEDHLAARPQKMENCIYEESERLIEQGGGVVHALPCLEGEPVYVVTRDKPKCANGTVGKESCGTTSTQWLQYHI